MGDNARWAPSPAARVDWSHPLAHGLIAVGCGTMQWSDRCPRAPSTLPSVIRPSIATPFGPGLGDRTADTDGAYQFTAPAIPTSMTLMAVVNCTGATPDDSGAIVWGSDEGESGVLLGVGTSNNPGPNIYVLDRGVAHRTTSTPIAQTGWRTIAVSTTTGGAMTIYLDGRAIQTDTGGHGTASTNPTLRVGAETTGQRAFDGQIAAWGAWNRILSAAEHVDILADQFRMILED